MPDSPASESLACDTSQFVRERKTGPKISIFLALPNSDLGCEAPFSKLSWETLQNFVSEMFSFFHVEDNGNMLTHFKDKFLTLHNLHFITAHSSLITAQMGSVTPLL